MSGILSRVFQQLSAGLDEDVVDLRPAKALSNQEVREIGESVAKSDLQTNTDLFSCFRLNGPDGLYAVLGYEIEDSGLPGIQQAALAGDRYGVSKIISDATRRAFVNLMDRHALDRIQAVESLPPSALKQFQSMKSYVEGLNAKALLAAAPVKPAAPVAAPVDPAPVVLSEDEQCIQAYNSRPTKEFRRLYGTGPRRTIWDRLVQAGRL